MKTELARTDDVMMARAKRIFILMIKVKKLFFLFFFSPRCSLHEIENVFFMCVDVNDKFVTMQCSCVFCGREGLETHVVNSSRPVWYANMIPFP